MNYELNNIRAQFFTGPWSGVENNFRTFPALLRMIANWLDEQGIEDAEVNDITFATEFDDATGSNFEVATVYYRRLNKGEEVWASEVTEEVVKAVPAVA